MPMTSFSLNAMKCLPRDARPALAANSVGMLAGSGRKATRAGKNTNPVSHRLKPLLNASPCGVAGLAKAGRLHPAGAAGVDQTQQAGQPSGALQIRRIVSLAVNRERDGSMMAPAVARPPGLRNLHGTDGSPGIECRLEKEVRKSIERRYLNRVFREGDPGCPKPVMPVEAFLKLVGTCNRVMEDLHHRFPGLRGCAPPNLAQTDLLRETGYLFGGYNPGSRTLCFADPIEHDLDRIWEETRARGLVSPQARGLAGLIIHEYAHHLCLGLSPEPHEWITSLVATLQAQGIVPERTNISRWDPVSGDFCDEVGDKAQAMGFGANAADNAAEFAAEALSWRMAPGYAESREIPRMPVYLENWLHESFPLAPDDPRISPAIPR